LTSIPLGDAENAEVAEERIVEELGRAAVDEERHIRVPKPQRSRPRRFDNPVSQRPLRSLRSLREVLGYGMRRRRSRSRSRSRSSESESVSVSESESESEFGVGVRSRSRNPEPRPQTSLRRQSYVMRPTSADAGTELRSTPLLSSQPRMEPPSRSKSSENQ